MEYYYQEESRIKEEQIQLFRTFLKEEQIRIHEPMAEHTTFRIGGPADLFLMPENEKEIQSIRRICREENIPLFILGNGSNLLVSDRGFRGVILQLYKNFSRLEVEGEILTASAGCLLSAMASAARNASLTGFEFAGGIPGTLGGAVRMNAGAYGGEMKDVVQTVRVLTPDGVIEEIPSAKMGFGYRTSIVGKRDLLVLGAVVSLKKGDPLVIRDTMRDLNTRRADRQPLEYPSAGSTFKRPEGYFAGKLIMEAGLAGYQVGKARVSEKHCGFVINTGGATASDVKKLIEDVRLRVLENSGVELEPEVRFLGDF